MQEEILLTVQQVSKLLHCNRGYVYELIKNNLLPVLKLGSTRVRKVALENFLAKYEGYDLSDPSNIKKLDDVNTYEVTKEYEREVS